MLNEIALLNKKIRKELPGSGIPKTPETPIN